jgi:uncharacterized phosphosugar-binding protein
MMTEQQSEKQNGVVQYLEKVTQLQHKVIAEQRGMLCDIAAKMAEVIASKGRIFLFGTGHSHILTEEAYFRAGGVAAAVPMFRPMILMLHEGARMSSHLERIPELATGILDEYAPEAGELLFVYADSGSNALPVQMAIEAGDRGVTVVGVGSLKYAQIAPMSVVGKKLYEVVDYFIDNGGTPGDALIKLSDVRWRVAASSTVVGATIWHCLLTETVRRLAQKVEDVPVFASYNMEGAPDHNEDVLETWSRINPHLPSHGLEKGIGELD